jgi:mono/diheme cytochrome c family protein
MPDLQKSKFQNLLATVLAVSIFMGSTVLAGFSQTANGFAGNTFKTNCVSCHAGDGRGSDVGKSLHVPDFHSSQVQSKTNAQLAEIIAQGSGNMPPFGGRLSNDQISALVKYIRKFRTTK